MPTKPSIKRAAVMSVLALGSVLLPAEAKEVVKTGSPGPTGMNGEPGDPGQNGTDGELAILPPAEADFGDPVNIAIVDGLKAKGGDGGRGGSGRPASPGDKNADGGDGGDAGNGGPAFATATTDWSKGFALGQTPIRAESEAKGGRGGQGGTPGGGAGQGQDGEAGNAGGGGGADARAKAEHKDGDTFARAKAQGGNGGQSVREGSGGSGGGGNASASSHSGGDATVTAEADAHGGNGGGVGGVRQVDAAGIGGKGGAASAHATAEGGSGDVTAKANAQGGSAGGGSESGAAGQAAATAAARNQGSGTVTVNVRSQGGSGGKGLLEGGKGAIATGLARGVSTGGGPVNVSLNVAGGDGPGGGAATNLENAAFLQTTGRGRLDQIARGGGSGDEGSGGNARSVLTLKNPGQDRLEINLLADGGSAKQAGGDGDVGATIANQGEVRLVATARGGHGGRGGMANVHPLFATSELNAPVTVRAYATGGSGAVPASASLVDSVDGETASTLTFEQYVIGGNGAGTTANGAEATGTLRRKKNIERLYLLNDSRGGDGFDEGAGAISRTTLLGENNAGDLVIRGESLGGAGGRSALAGSGGAAMMDAKARVGADGGELDLRVEANGGPGGEGQTDIPDKEKAAISQRRPDFEWQGLFGNGGNASTTIEAVSEASDRVVVYGRSKGGYAPAKGLFDGNGGRAEIDVATTALLSPDVSTDAQAYGARSRNDGQAGDATARLRVSARQKVSGWAKAIAGAGAGKPEARAELQGIGRTGSLTAEAALPFAGTTDRPELLSALVRVHPQDVITQQADETVFANIGTFKLSVKAGLNAEAPQAAGTGQTGSIAVTPFPPGEPDTLFAVAFSARHPISASLAQTYLDDEDRTRQQLAAPMDLVMEIHWPVDPTLADRLVRGTDFGISAGATSTTLKVIGLAGDSALKQITADIEGTGISLEDLFTNPWNAQARLGSTSPSGKPLDGMRLIIHLAPGEDIHARFVISRSDH